SRRRTGYHQRRRRLRRRVSRDGPCDESRLCNHPLWWHDCHRGPFAFGGRVFVQSEQSGRGGEDDQGQLYGKLRARPRHPPFHQPLSSGQAPGRPLDQRPRRLRGIERRVRPTSGCCDAASGSRSTRGMIAPTDRITAGYEVAWAAAQHGDREAIVCEGRSLTFREVNERANRLANALRGRGHDTGERIGVLLHNSIESVDSVFGLLKSGLCMVPLNTRHALPEQIEIANDAGLSGIIAGAEFKETVQALATSIEGLRTTVGVGWNP